MVTAGPRSVFRRYDDDTKLAEIGRSPPAGSLPRARRRRVFTICNCFILHNFLRGNFFSYEIFLTPLEAGHGCTSPASLVAVDRFPRSPTSDTLVYLRPTHSRPVTPDDPRPLVARGRLYQESVKFAVVLL